ncbi:hypothetical protein BZA77DRAFT_391799 [Pyronema omphalodes]|nr:hypothetical protein BZA77DRAFT_391799 [Pyronema omphalodes]
MPAVPAQAAPTTDRGFDPFGADSRPLIIIFIVLMLLGILAWAHEYWTDREEEETDPQLSISIRKLNSQLRPVCVQTVYPIRPFRPLPDDL